MKNICPILALSCKILGHSTFAISSVLFLIFSMTFPAMATVGEYGQVRHFVVSPNGRKIFFVSEKSNAEGHSWASVMLFDIATREVIGLTGEVKETALSPDKKIIAYVEKDDYYGYSLSLLTADGRRLKPRYHQARQRFNQLKWSKDSKYLSFVSSGSLYGVRTVVISPQIGVVPDELAKVEWQDSKQLPVDHPLYQKKPTVRADSIVLWGDDETIYVQAVDGIWKGSLKEAFVVRWTQLVAAEDIEGPLSISAPGTHLLYKRVRHHRPDTWVIPDIWVLPLETGTTPVKIGEGVTPQFTPDGRHVLFVHIGLWMVSLDGSSKRRLTRQKSF